MLWQELFNKLHIVVDGKTLCNLQYTGFNEIHCETCMNYYIDLGLQYKAICRRKQGRLEKPEPKSMNEPISNANIVAQTISVSESPSTIVNLGEWVEQKRKKPTTPQTCSCCVAREQQDATAGLNQTEKNPTSEVF